MRCELRVVGVDHSRQERRANFSAGLLREVGRAAPVLKIVHFFQPHSTLTRTSREHSCTRGQNWNRTNTTCTKNISGLHFVVAAHVGASKPAECKHQSPAAPGFVRLYTSPGCGYKDLTARGGHPRKGQNHGNEKEGTEKTEKGQKDLTNQVSGD